jgi:signal transduction histidine kinase
MTAAPRAPLVRRVPPGAWMVLLWCAAIACTLGVGALPATAGGLLSGRLRFVNGPRAVLLAGSFSSMRWEFLVLGSVMVLSAFLLRRRPLLALGVLLASSLASAAIPGAGRIVLDPTVPADIAVCFIAATRSWRVSAGSAAVAVGVLCGRWAVPKPPPGISAGTLTAWLVIVLAAAVAWLTGHAIRQNRGHAEALRANAVTAERLRIARELHDMVAHSIGIIAIQAAAGSRVIDTQPAVAHDALGAIEATSRETLAGLRRTLGALREPGQDYRADPASPGPAPGLADVGHLATTAMDAGVRVDVQWRGPRRQLPPDIDTSAFRIIQEAVTNVVRHAHTRHCQVIINQRDSELAIEITDDGRGGAANGTGYGIAGMRERAALLHGDLSAGPRPGGGFRVAARLPVPAPV